MKTSDTGKIEAGLTFHIPWWQFSDRDGQSLVWLANLIKAKNIYEIGCWTGHSTSYLAEYAKSIGGMVTVIDTFQGSPIMTVSIAADFDPKEEFKRNMKILKLDDRIKILHGQAHTFIRDIPNESIDLMFVDGDHRYSRVSQDLEEWWPKVRKGGILCGHDCESNQWDEDDIEIEEGVDGVHHGVVKAVFEKFPEANIEHSRIWWIIKK